MNSQTTWVKLRDVCETTSGGTPSRDVLAYYGGDIPWVKSGELLDGLITDTEEKITKAALASSSAKLFPAGTLLIALYGATVGRLGILGIEATTNQAVCGITPNEQLDRDFLFYYLLKQREKLIDSRTGGAQPNINQEIIRELDIPLPPLNEQKQIVSLLGRADRLRQLRQTAHDLGASVLHSVFLEMFGDVVKNEKGFDVYPFEELSTRITKGESPNWQGFSYEERGVLFITSENVLWGNLDISSPKYISEKFHNKLKRSQLAKNDLLINLVGASIGRAALVTENALPANINQAVATVSIDTTKLNLYFALYQILNPYKQNQLLGNIVESARANISLTNISELNLIVPPLSLQEEFAGVVARVESLRGRMGESTRQVEGLFESLLAESFANGEDYEN